MFDSKGIHPLMFAVLPFAMLIGCGSSELPFTDNSRDSLAFSKSIKELVLNTVERTKKSARPADAIRGIVLAVSELDACPVGDHMEIYKRLHSAAAALLAECEKGKPSNLEAKLEELAKIAEGLPGDLKVEKEKAKE